MLSLIVNIIQDIYKIDLFLLSPHFLLRHNSLLNFTFYICVTDVCDEKLWN